MSRALEVQGRATAQFRWMGDELSSLVGASKEKARSLKSKAANAANKAGKSYDYLDNRSADCERDLVICI